MIKKILKYPDITLKQKSLEVNVVTEETFKLISSMFETMYSNKGLGLAAIQIGVPLRVIVVDTGNGAKTLINPKIIKTSATKKLIKEGCLSFPGIFELVKRYDWVEAEYTNANNQKETYKFLDELEAQCVQHEIEHLDGILLLDNVPFTKKEKIKRKLKLR